MFVAKLFEDRPLRKVLLEVPEYNGWMVDGIVPCTSIPTLREHTFHAGRWWNTFIVEMTRREFSVILRMDQHTTEQLLSIRDR